MKPYYQDEWVTLYHGDCREILPELADIDLVLTSPPYYNAAKEVIEFTDYDSYLNWLESFWLPIKNVLVENGRLVVNIGAGYNRSPWLPLNADVTKQIQKYLDLRGQIIWDKGQQNAGQTAWGSWMSPANPSFRERHEVIIVASKGLKIKSIAGAGAVEAIGGSTGETAARLAIGQDLDISEIALEGLAEIPGGVKDIVF